MRMLFTRVVCQPYLGLKSLCFTILIRVDLVRFWFLIKFNAVSTRD